ncbi:MAG TPA: Bax inhibitor-1 family protein [Terriglobales bacterium]|nr:Bax inhibitor-1 family protein [Terriglobales bacterium]
MRDIATDHETVYSGPPLDPRPPLTEATPEDIGQVERDVNRFIVHVFGWIAGALLISAFFASYSDRWDDAILLQVTSRTLCMFIGGMLALAFVISRTVGKMTIAVAAATLIAYAAIQGSVFGLAYRFAYNSSLAPAYLGAGFVFALLCLYAAKFRKDLTSTSALLMGCALAMVFAVCSELIFNQPILTACALCAGSWLVLALAAYHRDFLRDLPASFDDDPKWEKAAAIGALQVYLDLVIILVIIIQMRWLSDFLSDGSRAKESERGPWD